VAVTIPPKAVIALPTFKVVAVATPVTARVVVVVTPVTTAPSGNVGETQEEQPHKKVKLK
jgi:Ni,Fe-hydrogenase III small subunit